AESVAPMVGSKACAAENPIGIASEAPAISAAPILSRTTIPMLTPTTNSLDICSAAQSGELISVTGDLPLPCTTARRKRIKPTRTRLGVLLHGIGETA